MLLLSRFSHVQLCATPWTGAYQAPPSMGFSRQEDWSGLPLPSDYIMLGKKSSPNNFYSRCIICHDFLHTLFIIWTDFLFYFLHTHTHTHRWRIEGTMSLHTSACPYHFLSRERLPFTSWLEYIMHLDLTLILLTEGGVF